VSRFSLPLPDEVPLYQGDLQEDLNVVSRNQLAEQITGGLSWPRKMPCPSWGISATRCRIGSILAQQAGTVCHKCYALRGRYTFNTVQAKLEERYRGLFHPLWTPAMIFLIRYYCDRYFRFFDSGDLQGMNHLRNIITIAEHTRDVCIWLPTREAELVRTVLREMGELPENLVIRVSAARIDGPPPKGFAHTSTVVSAAVAGTATCPAPEQGGTCAECRWCWDARLGNVIYRLH
jgi:hypothetical protein